MLSFLSKGEGMSLPPHNLTRTRKRDTSIAYDGITVRQSDLNKVFGGKDVFLFPFKRRGDVTPPLRIIVYAASW